MTAACYGSLADAKVRTQLEHAQQQPERWAVYLVQGTSEPRTAAQNRLFRALLRRFSQQQGRTVQYWHDYLVERFLGFEEVITEDGYVREVLSSTSDLTVAEFSEFLNACLAFADENHLR